MSAKRKHSRRLSLFGLGTSQPLSPGEQTPRPNTTASITLAIGTPAKQADDKTTLGGAQERTIRRKLSKKRNHDKKTSQSRQLAASPPLTSYSLSNTHLSELSHESDAPCVDQRRPSLKRKTSINVRAALSAIFMPKPSRKSVSGILDGMEGISGGKVIQRKKKEDKGSSYCYDSRSPSPPSPEIRPPSGLGQIASSVDLSTYVQEEYERGSTLRSLNGSRTPSVTHFIPTPPSDDPTANETLDTKSESSRDLFYQPSQLPATAPSETLKEVIDLSAPYLQLDSLSSLASASREFLRSARVALYTNIDSDNVGEDETQRRRMLQTLANSSEIASMVKSIRWVCLHAPSSSSSSLTTKHSIRRRQPTYSFSSSPEEYVLPRVLTLVPHLETLVLVQPHRSILQWFVPVHHSSARSPNASPVSTSSQSLPPVLTSLRSLTLSGRTTVSTTFGSILARFLELHLGIRELNLPDVFCLPNVHSLSRHGSSSSSTSSSPVSTPGHELIPPVPPLPPSYLAVKDKEPATPPLLPYLTKLSAPLTLATQLVPGRPVCVVDMEVTTSLYEGLRPAEVARALAEARELPPNRNGDENRKGKDTNWRAARHSRRFGLGMSMTLGSAPLTPITPTTPSPLSSFPSAGLSSGISDGESKPTNWKAARLARRAGFNHINAGAQQKPSLRELRMRCTAKVDCRTVGRMLIAIGKELGDALEVLRIVWSGSEKDLHTQLTFTLSRFSSLQRLEILAFIESDSDGDDTGDQVQNREKSETDLEASIDSERSLVEQWSRMCATLAHIEFLSGRVWRASAS